jgi:structure-specific endonuclease subunit SLX1
MNNYYVYLLESTNGSTYVGATINLDRRLRQHNGVIKGGAKRTTGIVHKGESWIRYCYVSGFPDWKSALQFEWRWKQLTRKIKSKKSPIEKRIQALNQLLSFKKSTCNAIPFEEWENNPFVIYENLLKEVEKEEKKENKKEEKEEKKENEKEENEFN